MTVFGPAPETTPNFVIHPCECLRCHDMPMIIHPAEDDLVECPYQLFLTRSLILPHDRSDFLQEHLRILFARLDEQLAAELAEVLSKEVEPFMDLRDAEAEALARP